MSTTRHGQLQFLSNARVCVPNLLQEIQDDLPGAQDGIDGGWERVDGHQAMPWPEVRES